MSEKAPETSKQEAYQPRPVNKEHRRRLRLGISLLVLIVIAGAAFLAWNKSNRNQEMGAKNESEVKAGPLVQTTSVGAVPEAKSLVLVGESRPYFETTLYAKVSGYLKVINVDEGARVKAGDVLAEIASPETDQAFLSAQADSINKGKVAARYRTLVNRKLVSRQEAEGFFTAAAMAKATLASAEQNKQYEIVRAPFDGVVTSRLVDPGDLVSNASNSKSTAQAILTVADTSRLKVNAYVDQRYAPFVHPGLPVQLFLSERMDERFPGTIARVAGALDRRTRMLPIEVDFDNAEKKIVAGSFVQVEVEVPSPPYQSIPVQALITQDGKPVVAMVTPEKKLKFTPVEIVDNDGSMITLSSGVKEGDLLALNIGEGIKDGQTVRVPEKKSEPMMAKKEQNDAVKSQSAAPQSSNGNQPAEEEKK
jgi:membrane fusion protein (multidrug efflux system)